MLSWKRKKNFRRKERGFRFPDWHHCTDFAFPHQWTHFRPPHGHNCNDFPFLHHWHNFRIPNWHHCTDFVFLHHWHHSRLLHGHYCAYFTFLLVKNGVGMGGCVWQKEYSVKWPYSCIRDMWTTVLILYITLTIISVNLIDWLMKIDEGRWRAQFKLNSYQLFKRLFIVSSYPLGLKSRLKENIESENILYIGDIH